MDKYLAVSSIFLFVFLTATANAVVTDKTYTTDEGMYAANEFFLTGSNTPLQFAKKLPPDVAWDAYFYSRYHLGNLVFQSGMGLNLIWGPVIGAQAKQKDAPEDLNGNGTNRDEQLKKRVMPHFAKLTGSQPPKNVWPVFADFASGDPHFIQKVDVANMKTDFKTLRWDGASMDKALTPSALGQTLYKQVLWAEYFLSHYHSEKEGAAQKLGVSAGEGFAGLALLGESINKMALFKNMLAYNGTSLGTVNPMTYDPVAGLKYFPHKIAVEFKIHPKESMLPPEPVGYRVVNASSDLFGQASLLWGTTEFKWMADPKNGVAPYNDLFDGDPFPQAGAPGPFDLAKGLSAVVFKNIKAMHFNSSSGTLVDTNDGSAMGDTITTWKAGVALIAVGNLYNRFADTPALQNGAKMIIDAQAKFILNKLLDEDGLFYNGYDLSADSPFTGEKTLAAQAGAVRGLLIAYEITGKSLYLEAAKTAYQKFDSAFWSPKDKLYVSHRGANESTYTPLNVALTVGALRELARVAGEDSAVQRVTDFFVTVVNDAGMQLSELLPTGEDMSMEAPDTDGDGIKKSPLADEPYGIAPMLASEVKLSPTSPVMKENVFFMTLQSGLNMVSLPLKPQIPYTARSFAEFLEATTVIKFDEKRSRFVGFTVDMAGDGFEVEGGKGYIVNLKEDKTVAFVGAAWTNQPPSEAAPSKKARNSAWAFVVTGRLFERKHRGRYKAIVKNLRTDSFVLDVVSSDKEQFAAVWVDLNRRSVVESGDLLKISVVDTGSNQIVGSIEQKVTPKDIANAFVSLRINLSDILPVENALAQNYPNPFNPETWIPYQLAQDADVVIKIYNIFGRLIRTLKLEHKTAGYYFSKDSAAYWDGKNDAGEPVGSGTYFYSLEAEDFTATKKLVILK